jgi:tetratricopeptide (TPR) repeat protein
MRLFACATFCALLIASACGRSAQSYLARGNSLFHADKFEEAELEYRSSLAKDPRFAEAYDRLGLTELQLGRRAAALAALRRAVDFAPANDQYKIDLATLSLEEYQEEPGAKNLYLQSADIASSLLQKTPNSVDGLRLHGELLILDRKYDEALAELQKAAALRPLDPAVTVDIARALLAQNRAPEAESLARNALQAHPDSAPLYKLLVGQYLDSHRNAEAEQLLASEVASLPRDLGARLRLAELYRSSGRRPEMQAVLNGIRNSGLFPHAPGLLGDFYAAAGEWEQALNQYRDGARSDAKSESLYRRGIAGALAGLGKPQEAIAELSQTLSAHPDDFSARLMRAMLLRGSNASKDREQAITDLKALAARSPQDAATRYNLGLAYLANDNAEAGLPELKKAAGLDPDDVSPRLALAQLSERQGDHGETLRLSEQVLAADAANADALLLHATALIGTKNYARARVELDSLLRSQPDSIDLNLRLAELDSVEQKYADAEARYRRLYVPGSGDLRPLRGLVQLYLTEMKPAKADAVLEQELKQSPVSQDVLLLAAATAVSEGKRAIAIQRYEGVVAHDPTSVVAWKSLGDVYQSQGDLSRAIANYEKASELAPRDEDVLNALALSQNAAGDIPAAIATFKKLLALDPQNAAVMNNLAFDLAETGTDLEQARLLAAAAARKLTGDPGVMDTLGWVYAKSGLNESAIQVFRVLVNKDPDHTVYRYHLGVAFLQDHQPVAAKSEFLIALSQKPPKELAQKIQQLSARL